MFGNKSDKYNKQQLERLQKLQEQGRLGLTPQQKQDIRFQAQAPAQKALADLQTLQPQSLNGITSGQAEQQRLSQQLLGGQLVGQTSAQADAAVRQADQQMVQQQRNEIENRLMQKTMANKERLAAQLSPLSAGLQAGSQAFMFQNLINPAISQPTATTAESIYQSYSEDPEALEYINSLLFPSET